MIIKNALRRALRNSVAAILLVAFVGGAMNQSKAAGDEKDYAQKLSQSHLFLQPLVWVGTNAPGAEETFELYEATGLDPDHRPSDRVASLETFVADHPNSPWTPSLQAGLAAYFRTLGRYSAALDYWQKAWDATKDASDPNSRKVADFTVAYWTDLLSSLGRVEKLQELINAVNGRRLSTPELQQKFDIARKSAGIMKMDPGNSFRCGSVALFHVAQALDAKGDYSSLAELDSPSTGFSLAQLKELSDQHHLGLVAVKRTSGDDLVVPSLIHWKENHYAAIVQREGGGYRVIDPTFGKPQWLSRQVINENASGYFLVSTNQVPPGWQVVPAADAKTIFGKGLHNGGEPSTQPSCTDTGNPALTTCPPGSGCSPGHDGGGGNGPGGGPGGLGGNGSEPGGPDGGGGGGPCLGRCMGGGGLGGSGSASSSGGMPDWEVSEPFISLWLHDRPMFYNMSFGRQFLLQMDYHQREDRPSTVGSYNFVNFGPDWDCNLLTYIVVDGNATYGNLWQTNCGWDDTGTNWVCSGAAEPTTFGDMVATEYSPDGGEQVFELGGTNGVSQMNPFTHVNFAFSYTNQAVIDYAYGPSEAFVGDTEHYASNSLVYPNGSVAYFDLVLDISDMPEEKVALITSTTDPQGHVMRYYYATNSGAVVLSQVVDFDGKTNNFIYTNTTFGASVTQVTNTAYGCAVNFKYDTNGFLTNIVDMAGISSSFQYMLTNEPYYTNYDGSGNPMVAQTNSVWIMTRMSTPYGDTKFDYFHITWPLFGPTVDANINRAITVTQPDTGKQLFLYSDESVYASPVGYPDQGITGNADFDANYSSFEGDTDLTELMNNSFHWGPRQYGLLSTTVLTNLTPSDFFAARLRNWLHSIPETQLSVGQVLNAEQEPSPIYGSSYGLSTWYAYEGKPAAYSDDGAYTESTNDDLPVGFGQVLDQLTAREYYENISRNSNGFPTKVVEFGDFDGGGNLGIRTNSYIYAANNIDLLEHIGPDGVPQELYAYDGYHNVIAMTNAVGEVTRYTYNAMGQVTGITYPNLLVTTNFYGSDGFLATTYDFSGTTYFRTNSYTYTNGLVLTHTDERGLTITNSWDALQRLKQVSYPDGTAITYTYSNLDLVRVVDRMGFTNSYTYDNMRRKTGETNALGNATVYSYCTCGALESIQDALTNLTRFSYDSGGRLTNTVYADNYTVGRTLNTAGMLMNVTTSSEKSIDYQYDGLKRKVGEAAEVAGYSPSQIDTFGYDLYDRPLIQTNANGVVLNMTYDPLHRLISRRYPDTGVELFGYTFGVSGMTSYTNQLQNVWNYAYDAMQRKTNEIVIGVYTNSFVYSPAGDLLTLIDGKGQKTSWNYDMFGRVTNKLDNLNTNLFIYGYDADNRLTNRVSAAKGSTLYSYDAVGNLTFINYPVSPDITLQYDALNRLTNMVDAVGTTKYSYDAVGQVLSEDGPWDNDTVSYTYANRLRIGMSLQAPNASPWTQSYGYDFIDRLSTLTSPAGTFGYDFGGFNPETSTFGPGSLVRRLSLPNGAYVTNIYDSMGRMTATYLRNSSDVNLDTEDYVYDLGGQRTEQVFTAGNYMNYTYDSIGELKTALGHEPNGTTNRMQEQFGYAYDPSGNLNYYTNNALLQQFNVNSLNELMTVTNGGKLTVVGSTTSLATNVTVNGANAFLYVDATFASSNESWSYGNSTYTAIGQDTYGRRDTNAVTVDLQGTNYFAYDSNGNLLTNGTRVFEYDDENQLIRITEPNVWKSEFTYDGKMRRRIRREYTWNGSSWLQTNEVHYIYDGKLVIEERNGNNLPQVTYTRGMDMSGSFEGAGGIGGLLARTDMSLWTLNSSLAHAFYHADGGGNIAALIYANQAIAAEYKYDPFGNILSKTGPLADANCYQFSSKEYHQASALIYYLYRYYSADLKRWMNADPIQQWGGLNLYAFVQDNPVTWCDDFGFSGVPLSPATLWPQPQPPPGNTLWPQPQPPPGNTLWPQPPSSTPPSFNPTGPFPVPPTVCLVSPPSWSPWNPIKIGPISFYPWPVYFPPNPDKPWPDPPPVPPGTRPTQWWPPPLSGGPPANEGEGPPRLGGTGGLNF